MPISEFVERNEKGRRKNLEDLIKEFDENRNFSQTKPEGVTKGENEQLEFIRKFPPEKILEMKIDDYVAGKVPINRNTFSYMSEFGTNNFGQVRGGSATKHIVYVDKETQEYQYNHSVYRSSQEAFQGVIQGIDNMLKAARQFILDGDWNKLSKGVEGRKYFFSIPILSKILALYFPDTFFRIWSQDWINFALDRFGISKGELDEDGDFYIKQGLLFKFKNSHPIMKEWTSSFFSHFIRSLKEDGEGPEDIEAFNVEPLLQEETFSKFKKKYAEILEKKKQIIFYGPPGTGKTYEAKLFAEEFTSQNFRRKNGDEPKTGNKTEWFEYLKKKLQQIAPSYKIDNSEGEEYFSLKYQNDEKKIRVFYGNKERAEDSVEVGFKEKPISWLGEVQMEDRFFIIINLSNSSYVVLPYVIAKEKAQLRGGEHWDSSGDISMWFTMSSLNENTAILNANNSVSDGKFDCRKFLFNLDRVFVSDIEYITFHQSYSYEEFIEGIRARTTTNSQLEYYVEDGIFKRICQVARKDKKNKYVLLIDEINRGNISKIFGEMITVIEKDKRETIPIKLTYSKERFSIPLNVFIIGTMNTADRSLVQIDIALRRRFGFAEFMPNPKLLENVDDISLSQLLSSLNNRIISNGGNREHQIGHSYFMISGRSLSSISDLKFVFETEIIPLLQEYFFEDYDKLEKVLGPTFIDSQKLLIKDLEQIEFRKGLDYFLKNEPESFN